MATRVAAARRYAQAAFEIARDTNMLDEWLGDLKTLNGVFGSSQAVSMLEDPKLTLEDQNRVVDRLVQPGVVRETPMNLLRLLIHRRRLPVLPRLLEIYQEMYNKEKGIVVAEVTTAVPLDEENRKRVAARLSEITGGKTIELRLHEDPAILGGMITRIGDMLIDASVATRLAELGERLA